MVWMFRAKLYTFLLNNSSMRVKNQQFKYDFVNMLSQTRVFVLYLCQMHLIKDNLVNLVTFIAATT